MNPALLIGGALLLYYLYSKSSASASTVAALPSDVVYVGNIPAGETISNITGPTNVYFSPSTSLYYPSTQAPTQAQVTGGSTILQGATTPVAKTSAVPPTPVTVEPPPATLTPSLASIYASILAGISTDPNFTGTGTQASSTPYRFNTYLGLAYPAQPTPNLNTVFPGVDLNQNMTLATYWGAMGPYLTKLYGLSGLGLLSGLGFRNYGGWAA